MKDRLQKQIPQLRAQLLPVSPFDGVGNLKSLFNGIGGDAGEILFDVPGAARVGVAQPRHDRNQPGQPAVGVVNEGIVSHCSAFVFGVECTLT